MKRSITAILVFAICGCLFSADFPQVDGKRPFKEKETIDINLLQLLINRRIAEVTKKGGANIKYEQKVADAANVKLRNPGIKDETDTDGFFVPAVKIILKNGGYKCGFLVDYYVEAKTICPTIRHFDSTDTYENIAARFVKQLMDGNKAMIMTAKTYGAGVYLYDDWERNAQGPIYNEPKCQRIKVYFVFIIS